MSGLRFPYHPYMTELWLLFYRKPTPVLHFLSLIETVQIFSKLLSLIHIQSQEKPKSLQLSVFSSCTSIGERDIYGSINLFILLCFEPFCSVNMSIADFKTVDC